MPAPMPFSRPEPVTMAILPERLRVSAVMLAMVRVFEREEASLFEWRG